MEPFCRDKLREQAWRRFQRYVRKEIKKTPVRGAETQWCRDVFYIEKLNAVVEWCESKGIDVVMAKKANGTYEHDAATITLTCRASPEKQLHYLLHECGHHLIGMKEHHERFGKGYPQGNNPKVMNTFEHKLACLEEEIEAWHRGWKLSRRLRLDVDRGQFDATRVECLRTYVEWTSKKKERKLK